MPQTYMRTSSGRRLTNGCLARPSVLKILRFRIVGTRGLV